MNFQYKNSSLINESGFNELLPLLQSYSKQLQLVVNSHTFDAPESSVNLPSDKNLLEIVMKMVKKKISSKLKYIVDIGIGGSNLGTKAVYDALYGFYDVLEPNRFPKMIFLDTTDENLLLKCSKLIQTLENKDEFLINTISKSGGTTETIANLEIILRELESKFGDVHERLVITTDEGSKLWELAYKNGVDVLPIPKTVGGRFSVLSAVGLLPLACCSIDVDSLRKGAEKMRTMCLSSDISENIAALSAAIIYLHNKNGKNINDTFFFLPQLESIGKWYRQLTGESLGKELDLQGKKVHAGITPTVSIGSTDLHSVGQLYLGGPRDKITTFVYASDHRSTLSIPATLQFPLVDGITGKKPHEIMSAILEGVKIAYKNQNLPYMEVSVNVRDEFSLGEFLQFKMIEMMYLGKLLNVNTFDQPHVELYKSETKKILEG